MFLKHPGQTYILPFLLCGRDYSHQALHMYVVWGVCDVPMPFAAVDLGGLSGCILCETSAAVLGVEGFCQFCSVCSCNGSISGSLGVCCSTVPQPVGFLWQGDFSLDRVMNCELQGRAESEQSTLAFLNRTVAGHPLTAVVMLCSLLLTLSQGGPGFLCKHGVVIAAVEQAELETAGGMEQQLSEAADRYIKQVTSLGSNPKRGTREPTPSSTPAPQQRGGEAALHILNCLCSKSPLQPCAYLFGRAKGQSWFHQLLPLVSRKLKYHKYTTITLHRSIKIADYAYPSKCNGRSQQFTCAPWYSITFPPDDCEALEARGAVESQGSPLCSPSEIKACWQTPSLTLLCRRVCDGTAASEAPIQSQVWPFKLLSRCFSSTVLHARAQTLSSQVISSTSVNKEQAPGFLQVASTMLEIQEVSEKLPPMVLGR
ncbi:hypothetical protein EK904_000129 [Melospiza melodia maxima]|nr:hypothetical protein EK904_000129 [Melospiza melodia maxima]